MAPCASTTSLPERSASWIWIFAVPTRVAPRPPLLAQRLQRPDPPLVAGAARLDPLAHPDLLLGQLLVEERLPGDLRRQQLLPPRDEGVVAAVEGVEPAPVQLRDPVGETGARRPGRGSRRAGS